MKADDAARVVSMLNSGGQTKWELVAYPKGDKLDYQYRRIAIVCVDMEEA